MIKLSIDEIQPGMKIARSVLGANSGTQLTAGFVLDEAVIERCKRVGMHSLWVHMEGEDVVPTGNINDQLALQAQQAWKDNMDMLQKIGETQDSTLESITRFKSDPGRFKNIIATEQMKSIVEKIIKSILGQEPLVVNLASMRTKDGFLHQHALDVTITATLIATRLRLNLHEIQELALGCFLMDLGMIMVPQSVFDKRGPLTLAEKHVLQEHPSVGFAILRTNEGISPNVSAVAYQHHERLDGTGYPRELKSEDKFPIKNLQTASGAIIRYAQIAAVADEYNAAVSPRPGSAAPTAPLQAMRTLIERSGKSLNSHVVNALITMIPAFPVGTRIVVTKSSHSFLVGHMGVVAKDNPLVQEKPQIILLMDKFKRKVKPVVFDLMHEKGMEIQFVVV